MKTTSKSYSRPIVFVLSLVTVALFSFLLSTAEAVKPVTPAPVIISAVADFNTNTIIITGQNFSNSPSVFLDNMQLVVTTSNATSIQATLPSGIAPASYHLVERNANTTEAFLDVTLGNLADGTAAGNTPYWDGATWIVTSRNIWNEPLNGNVGISTSSAPVYKLDVLHGGATGIRCRSSGTFSIIDIDGSNGDAAIRFARAGVNQWNIRNNPANDDLQIFELGGGGERLRIENGTGKVVVDGDFTTLGTKMFTIDHPLDPENKLLMHAAAESNEVINFYSGNVTTGANGKATVVLPDYFETLNKDFRYQLTVIGVFAQAIVSREVTNNTFEIATSVPNVRVSWEVKGLRNDAYMQKHPFKSVVEKTAQQKASRVDDPSVPSSIK